MTRSPLTSRGLARLLLLILCTALLAGAAHAKSSGKRAPAEIRGASPEKTVMQGRQEIGLESGVPRALFSVDHAVRPADPETMARQYLSEHASKLRLDDAGLGDLVVRATRKGIASTTVRFEQRVQGIPVLAPDVVVTIDSDHKVTYVLNGYEPGLSLAETKAAVASEQARTDVLARLGVDAKPAFESTRLAVRPEGKTARLVWQVKVVPSGEPHGDWHALVDAATGEIVELENRALHANGTGYVFDPDPLGTAHATYGQTGFTDGNDAATAQLNAARSSRTLLDITDIGGGVYKLQGPFATIVDTESPFKGLFTQASTTFNFDRSNDAFEAVNCYYHVDHMMRYINNVLGVSVMPYQYAGGVRFDPSGLSGDDNSHYTTSNGVIAFGEGGVDDAEDADVVIHELGHGLHDWLTAGGLSQVNGLSEGTGDYVCQSYSRSLGQWASNEAPYHWTFSWDGHNEFWGGRITNSTALYPGGLTGQIHTDGQIWATCLMRIWNQLGRDKTDRAVYEGLAMTNSSTNQNQAAQAVIQAAISMGYSSADVSVMANEMRATGYTISIGVDYVSNLLADECASNSGNVNGLLEPGETATLQVSLVASSTTHTGVVGTLTSTTPGVTILDGSATWANLPPGVTTLSDAPHFRIRLDESVACLSTVDFQLSVSSNEGGPYVSNFSRPVGSALTPSGLPLAIPDNTPAGTTSTLNVGTNVVLTDVNVRVAITHTWVGDLFIKLRSPAGTEVTLLDRPGVPASTYGCSNDNMNVTFDDAGALVLEGHCAGTNPWYAGVARPVGSLAAFNGQSSQGNWVLTVSDNAGSDTGTLTSWELITTPVLSGACTTCDNTVGVPATVGRGGLALSQNRPTPFSGSTAIEFRLPQAGRAQLGVYDVRGRHVTTLLDRELAPGPHTVTWDGTDRDGHQVAPGLYFYQLTSGGSSVTRRTTRIQ